jgi:hypothetical protein
MAELIGNVLCISDNENVAACEDCGETRDLRPYGPGGTNVCVECAEKTPQIMRGLMTRALAQKLSAAILLVGPEGQVVRNGQPLTGNNEHGKSCN